MSRLYETIENVSNDFECVSSFSKEGRSITVAVYFDKTPIRLMIQQSVDNKKFLTIPDSITEKFGEKESMWMWNDSTLPEGTFVRVAGSYEGSGTITIKVLTDN